MSDLRQLQYLARRRQPGALAVLQDKLLEAFPGELEAAVRQAQTYKKMGIGEQLVLYAPPSRRWSHPFDMRRGQYRLPYTMTNVRWDSYADAIGAWVNRNANQEEVSVSAGFSRSETSFQKHRDYRIFLSPPGQSGPISWNAFETLDEFHDFLEAYGLKAKPRDSKPGQSFQVYAPRNWSSSDMLPLRTAPFAVVPAPRVPRDREWPPASYGTTAFTVVFRTSESSPGSSLRDRPRRRTRARAR